MRLSRLAFFLVATASLAAPAAGEKPVLAMLGQLDPGGWELRMRGDGTTEKMCLNNGRQLIQIRHPGIPCASVIVEDSPNDVTVQYTCRGHGFGRTHIRRETDTLVQIDSQGIASGIPFSFAAEGRRIGACR